MNTNFTATPKITRLTPLTEVKGVSSRLAQSLARLGLHSIEDAFYHLPLRYNDFRQLRKISHLRTDTTEIFCGRVLVAGAVPCGRNKSIFEVVVSDGTGQVRLKWFQVRGDWLKKRFSPGRKAIFIGDIASFGSSLECSHPESFFFDDQSLPDFLRAHGPPLGSIVPVYPLTQGLNQKTAQHFFSQLVRNYALELASTIPDDLLQQNNLLPLGEALNLLHNPCHEGDFEQFKFKINDARKSLVYDEFFYLHLGLGLRKKQNEMLPGRAMSTEHRYTAPVLKQLPFDLTGAQRRVLGEIKNDLSSPIAMNRLIQGDVGSGKTIVALMAALLAIENGLQVAMVAPTEILAEQHHVFFSQWLGTLGLNSALLTGRHKRKERGGILAALASGQTQMAIGTHALLQDDVVFHDLGLGIIDEQHRFGVRQRMSLRQKGEQPDIMVMTATPIPRTLCLTCYGDLSVSLIDELPPGRKPVETLVMEESQRLIAYKILARELEQGRQGYVIYPLVEESEKSDLTAASEGAQALREYFSNFNVGLIHGKLPQAEKNAVMTAFKQGEYHLLVATTVIEVGIDVSNATYMLIEHAERFGLAQLHQLRGRVGRGSEHSRCILLHSSNVSNDALQRLEVMRSTNDGFRIAEADFAQRGPGDLLGVRQAGVPDFRVGDLLKDQALLDIARTDALSLISSDGTINHRDCMNMQKILSLRWKGRLSLVQVG